MSEPAVSLESVKDDVIGLKAEIDRLNRELAQTSAEKIQSAQYGLVLLVIKRHSSYLLSDPLLSDP